MKAVLKTWISGISAALAFLLFWFFCSTMADMFPNAHPFIIVLVGPFLAHWLVASVATSFSRSSRNSEPPTQAGTESR